MSFGPSAGCMIRFSVRRENDFILSKLHALHTAVLESDAYAALENIRNFRVGDPELSIFQNKIPLVADVVMCGTIPDVTHGTSG